MNELYHHGIKGQQWGVRRYQYTDGTLTPAGKQRYRNYDDSKMADRVSRIMNTKVKDVVNGAKTKLTGKQYVDGYLKNGTTFSRIQTSKEFDNVDDIAKAKELRAKSDNMKVYQLKLESTKKLRVPSDENAAHITANLLKEKEFKDNLIASIQDSKEKMRRPQQQILFNQAQNALKKDPIRMTKSEKVAVYKALNLSLTNHNPQEIAAQNRFYGELKKKGYNALLDYNDKEYSSYHAKRPMIVFDTDSVKLQSVTEANPKVVDRLYRRYNSERIMKESVASTVGVVSKYANTKVSECKSYVNRRMEEYLR